MKILGKVSVIKQILSKAGIGNAKRFTYVRIRQSSKVLLTCTISLKKGIIKIETPIIITVSLPPPPPLVIYYRPVLCGNSVVLPVCYMLCMNVYGL